MNDKFTNPEQYKMSEYFDFLKDLRSNGFVHMDNSVKFLSGAFGLHEKDAQKIYKIWESDPKISH